MDTSVRVTNPDFGIKYFYVNVQGPYGWSDGGRAMWSDLQDEGDPDRASVVFDVPAKAIPEGRQFRVCASDNIVSAFLDSNCKWFTYGGGGDTEVEVRLP